MQEKKQTVCTVYKPSLPDLCSKVKDIHDYLDVTVFDEDKDHKYEFLGKVRIPLLRIRNNEKRWYTLKDKKLRKPAKSSGECAQVMLEMFFVYNKVNLIRGEKIPFIQSSHELRNDPG